MDAVVAECLLSCPECESVRNSDGAGEAAELRPDSLPSARLQRTGRTTFGDGLGEVTPTNSEPSDALRNCAVVGALDTEEVDDDRPDALGARERAEGEEGSWG